MNDSSWWEREKAGCARLLLYILVVFGGAALFYSYRMERDRAFQRELDAPAPPLIVPKAKVRN
jgi:hypothetical protein